MQSKTMSFIESWTNVFIGWGVAIISQVVIFPLYNINIPLQSNLKISAWFTLVSAVRSYIVRRFFNNKTTGMYKQEA